MAPKARLLVAACAALVLLVLGLYWWPGSRIQERPGDVPELGGPPNAAAQSEPAAQEGAGLAEERPSQEGAAASGRAERPAVRRLIGQVRMPAGLAAEGGRAVLQQAGLEDARSFATMMGGITERDRENLDRLFGGGGPVLASVKLAAAGRFEFRDPPSGPMWLSVRHPIARLARPLHLVVAERGDTDAGELVLELAPGLLVEVRDARERPIRGARVEIFTAMDLRDLMDPRRLGDMTELIGQLRPETGRTDVEGRADFPGLRPSPGHLVRASQDGYASAIREVPLAPGQRRVVTLRLMSGAGLEAVVRDENGAPLPRCRAVLRYTAPPETRHDYQAAQLSEQRLRADHEGRLHSESLRAGRAELRIDADGHLPLRVPVELRHGETLRPELELSLGLVVAGRVVGPDDEALAGARVQLLDEMMSASFLGLEMADFVGADLVGLRFEERGGVACDDDGRFVIGGLREGEERKLMAIAPDHAVEFVGPVRPGQRDIVVRLQRTARITGRVVADETGEAIRDFVARANIKAWMYMSRPVSQHTVRGSEDGRFELAGFAPQSIQLEIESAGRETHSQRIVATSEPLDLGTIRLGPPAGVAGRVLDPHGAPVPGAEVRVAKGGMADMGMLAAMTGAERTETDAEGEFLLQGVGRGRMRLLAEKDGFAVTRSEIVRIEPGRITRGVEIRLGAGGEIRGRIIDAAGLPVDGWSIYVSSTRASTMKVTESDADGRFGCVGLAAGPYELAAFPTDLQQGAMRRMQREADDTNPAKMLEFVSELTQKVIKQKLTVREGEVHEVELVVTSPEGGDAGTRVQGVVEIGDEAITEGFVEFMTPGRPESPRIAPLSKTGYLLRGIAPGTYLVRARAGLFAAPLGSEREVAIPETAMHRLDLRYPATSLSGRVLDAKDGSTVAGCVLTLEGEGERQTDPLRDAEIGEGLALSGPDGGFRFRGLTPGRYRIHARESVLLGGRGRSGTTDWIRVEVGAPAGPVELRVGGAAQLQVSVENDAGRVAGALVRLLDEQGQPTGYHHLQVTDAEGVARFEGLPPGRYRVLADDLESAPALSEILELERDQLAERRLRLRPGVPVQLLLRGVQELSAGEIVAWSIWREDGTLVRAGRMPVSRLRVQPEAQAAGAEHVFGKLMPGRYRLRVESRGLGRRETTREVPQQGVARWEIEATGR